MIDSKNISVVITGLIEKETAENINSIRKYLPKAEIILSTWENENIQGLYCDKIILNKDPGGFIFCPEGKANNNNRIIISSQAGIKASSRLYILRMRSDLKLINNNILKIKNNYKRGEYLKLFKKRIIGYPLFSLKFENKQKKHFYRPFHISDWMHFGLNEDITTLFDIPLAQEPEHSLWFKLYPQRKNFIKYNKTWRMSPEQWIHSRCAIKHFSEIKFNDIYDITEENKQQSEIFIANNFLIPTKEELGIISTKKIYQNISLENSAIYRKGGYIPYNYWNDYKKLYDHNFIINEKYKPHKYYYPFEKIKKHTMYIQKNKNKPIVILKELFSIFYYLILAIFGIIKKSYWEI